jgi:hypothetical protein
LLSALAAVVVGVVVVVVVAVVVAVVVVVGVGVVGAEVGDVVEDGGQLAAFAFLGGHGGGRARRSARPG